MRLTMFTDFGLRVLMRLAGEPDRSLTTKDIAREFSISRHHLTKVVRDLANAGYLVTQRGAGGGLRLARAAEKITLGEVVRSLEARSALVDCFRADGGACALTPQCRLKRHLAAAQEAFLSELDGVNLAGCAYPAPPERTLRRSTQHG